MICRIQNVFSQFTVDSYQPELMNLFEVALRRADEVTMLPMIIQGEQAPHMTEKTAQGLAMLNNNANIVQKRAVKSFDDWLTVPLLTRMYDWEMQFNDRAEIKGDCCVVAKGASVLMEKEMQSQTMMQFMQFKGGVWDPYFNWYEVAEQVSKNLRIQKVLATEEEAKEGEQRMQEAAAAAEVYFAIRLSGAADVPASKGKAILLAVLALAVTFGGTLLLFSGGASPKPILQAAGVVVVIAALTIMRRVWPTYWNALLAYALGARIPVLVVMYLAIKGRWGTHYDVLPPGMSFQSFTQEYLVSAFYPQLFLWVPFTVIFCGIFGLVALAVRRRGVATTP